MHQLIFSKMLQTTAEDPYSLNLGFLSYKATYCVWRCCLARYLGRKPRNSAVWCNTLASVIVVTITVLCLWPWRLMCSTNTHETMPGWLAKLARREKSGTSQHWIMYYKAHLWIYLKVILPNLPHSEEFLLHVLTDGILNIT
jgi:hypothetical protein